MTSGPSAFAQSLNGAAVKALREALGIKGSHFAIQCHMTHGQLSNIEAGRRQASADAARRIADELQREFRQRLTDSRVEVDVWAAINYHPAAQEAAA